MRTLATIQRIESLTPIPNADSIEVAKVLGWNVVVKKGEFKQYDRCVYVEIDSVLPERPEFEFLRKNKFRIKTIKLRGQISQGICFPLSILPEPNDGGWWKDGDDATEVLGIKKYDPEVAINSGMGAAYIRSFPSFIPKTDEARIQSMPSLLRDKYGMLCYVTEKLDGSSFTFFVEDNKLAICSRNQRIDLVPENEGNIFYNAAIKFGLEDAVKLAQSISKNRIAFQGELIGPKLNGNKYKLEEIELRLFSVFDIDEQLYLNYDKLELFASIMNIKTVPLLHEHYVLQDSVDKLVELSVGKSTLNASVDREGIVVRAWNNMLLWPHRTIKQFSFKVINPEYLLKYE